jgi:hypothetical protein
MKRDVTLNVEFRQIVIVFRTRRVDLETAAELNNKFFTVSHSISGGASTAIDTVKANGTANVVHTSFSSLRKSTTA